MKATDIVIGIGVAVVVVVVYQKFFATPATTSSSSGSSPTLNGVAGIVGATSGLINSIANLVKPAPKPDADGDAKAMVAMIDDDGFSIRNEQHFDSGFAIAG